MPDTEAWAVAYLSALLPADVFVGIADARAGAKRVLVRRDGGPTSSVVSEIARLSVRCFAHTEAAASDLARLAQAHLAASEGIGPVRRYDGTSGPSWVPDPTGPCYLLTCELTVVGTPL